MIRYYVALFAVVIASYWNIFPNGYIGDDHYLLENHRFFSDWGNLYLLFTRDSWDVFWPEHGPVGYWRPLFLASFYFDNCLPLPTLVSHHLVDLLLYFGAVIVVFRFLFHFVQDATAAALGAVFFAAWPLHTDSVTLMLGREYSMCAILWIGAYMYSERYCGRGPPSCLWISCVFFALSLLCVESAIVFPFMALPMLFRGPGASGRRVYRLGASFIAVIITYLAYRKWMIPIKLYPPEHMNLELLWDSGAVALRSFRAILWPFDFVVTETPAPLVGRVADGFLGLFLGTVGLLAVVISYIKRCPKGYLPLLLYLTPLLLVIPPYPRGSVYQDRYLFLPSVGLALAIGYTAGWLRERGSARLLLLSGGLMGVCVLSFIFTSLARNFDFRNDISFWCTEADRQRTAFDANKRCGKAFQNVGRDSEALVYYDRALNLKLHPDVINDYGVILAGRGQCKDALRLFRFLRKRDETYIKGWKNEIACIRQLKDEAQLRRVLPAAKKAIPREF